MDLKKEQIKDRMIKTVGRLWNVPDNEIETNFDPLILLLLEACAAELEKIGFEITASHERLLDRLADLILPEAVIGPRPASCIVTANPAEIRTTLTSLTSFFVALRFQNSNLNSTNLNLFFTPVGDFLIYKVKLAYTFIGKKLYKINTNAPRELIFNGDSASTGRVNEIWLAISPDKASTSLRGLSLYFDLRTHSKANTFYSCLPNVTAFVSGDSIKIGTGYFNQTQFDLNPEEMLLKGHDHAKKINRKIAGVYQNQFLHIDDDVSAEIRKMPDEWEESLPKTVSQKISSEPLIFIKLTLNRYFIQDELDGLTCSINAFPVVNRKFNTLNYRTDPWINIIPIQAEGNFLDLHSITTSAGGTYQFRIAADSQNLNEGEALIKSSGVGKTNSREVREIISSLMNAIRDENAYFTELSNDFVLARLKEINQILSRLDDQLHRSKDNQPALNYILLKPKNAGENIIINYWSINGTLGNQIKAGTFLTPHNHTLVSGKEIYTITNAVGGKETVTDAEKKLLLKQQLVSNGKIVSIEDIKMLCMQIFGDRLSKVVVKKGVDIGTGKSEGFFRTIDILLTLFDKENIETDYLRNELMYTLQNNATFAYPFRVIIE